MIIQYKAECYELGKYALAIKTDDFVLFEKLLSEINNYVTHTNSEICKTSSKRTNSNNKETTPSLK